MYDYSYIGRLLQIFWKLFVIFKLSKQFCENYNVGAWFNYVLGKYFDSLNVANLELQIMAKRGQITKYMYIVLWFMCCTLVPCFVYWCLAVLISLCGISLWCQCGVFMASVDLRLMISVIFVHCTARARRMIVKRR